MPLTKSIQRLCAQCARKSTLSRPGLACTPLAARRLHTTPSRNDSSDIDAEREAARQRAWYLEPSPTTRTDDLRPPPSSASSTPASESTRSPRQPIFTSYDPSRTTTDLDASIPSAPLPPNAPGHLVPLHEFLTGSELIQGGSVIFVHTPSSTYARTAEAGSGPVTDQGIAARNAIGTYGENQGEGEGDMSGAEPSWEWVVVAVVRGRGKGVVARAERALRIWLKDNQEPKLRTNRPPRRMPRVEAEADWSVVPIGEGICVNLFTAEGRDKWKLDELWLGQ